MSSSKRGSAGVSMFVDRLRRNRTDGASAMARQALGHMAEFVRTAELNADLPGRVRSCCAELARARPSMAAIGNLMEHWAATFSWPEPDSTFKEQALAHVQHVLGQVGRARREAVARAIKVLPDGASILTHSTSGTVRDVLDSLDTCPVMVTASEPGGEGRRFAEESGARGIEDTAVGEHLSDIDAVLVGADAVLANGDFVNKIGTRAIAEAAGQQGVPFYVVFESFKRLPGNRIRIDEPVFELTPAAVVTEHITDSVFKSRL